MGEDLQGDALAVYKEHLAVHQIDLDTFIAAGNGSLPSICPFKGSRYAGIESFAEDIFPCAKQALPFLFKGGSPFSTGLVPRQGSQMGRQFEIGTKRSALTGGITGNESAVFHILFVSATVFARLSTGLRPTILFHTLRDPAHPILVG